MSNKFYITTAIAYTNAPPHIGFALELVQADVLARLHGLRGEKRFFLTGTDEHGRKNMQAAQGAGKKPEEFVDEMAGRFEKLARALNVSNDDFIRTSDQDRHWPGVVQFWKQLQESGDLYKAQYEGLYCSGCEAFKKQSDLEDGMCPDHGKVPDRVKEENWFFRLSKYQKELTRIIGADELRIVPDTRKNEVLSFIAQGLEDVSFSRPRRDLPWGVPVPGDDAQTIYVWADALVNYLTGIGYGHGPGDRVQGTERFETFWPADIHVIGKDILRFHAVIWPAMLLSARLTLPKILLVHGHILSAGKKMSKTIGNVVDPFAIVEKYGVDAVRYFLLKEIPTTADGDFTEDRFLEVYTSSLANNLGNLVGRIAALGKDQEITVQAGQDIQEVAKRAWAEYEAAFAALRLDEALGAVDKFVGFGNEFVERTKPWEGEHNLHGALPQLAWMLGNIAWMLAPLLPETARKIFDQLGLDPGDTALWEGESIKMKKGASLFPRF